MKKEIIEKFEKYRQDKSLKGTETEKNLLKSFAGESQARNRYHIFAELARKEGYDQIAAIFDETAHNEKVFWFCRECGHIHYGTKAPKTYPKQIIIKKKRGLLAFFRYTHINCGKNKVLGEVFH